MHITHPAQEEAAAARTERNAMRAARDAAAVEAMRQREIEAALARKAIEDEEDRKARGACGVVQD